MVKNKLIKSVVLLAIAIVLSPMAFSQTKIIAHRGYWDCAGSAQNSLASLNKAHEIKAYGAEFDVHLTEDGIAVINHDDSIQGLSIENSTYEQLKDVKLANGERMPTLAQCLAQGKQNKGTQLILEIKPHKTKEAEDRAVATVLALVKKHKAERITEYISFSINICKELIRQAPKARIAYLKGDLSPQELKQMGFTGLDYHYKIMQLHPEWIKEAKDLGLSVNVWTVNDASTVKAFMDQGIGYITTDKPVEMTQVVHSK